MKRIKSAADWCNKDVAVIADLPPLQDITHDQYDADYVSDNLSALGGAECKAPISLKQIELSLEQFVKSMVQPNCSTFHNGRKYGWLSSWRRTIDSVSGDRCS
jgi:hypothetical protein